jgi:DNA-binding transcriptional regulator LsrR (DeoR family)
MLIELATPAVAGLAAYFIAKEGLATPAAVTNRIIGASTANVIKNPNGVSYGPYNRLAYNADGY